MLPFLLGIITRSPWNGNCVRLQGWVGGKMVLAEREEVFFQFRARSKCWHCLMCVWGQWHRPAVTRLLFCVPCSDVFGMRLQNPQLLYPPTKSLNLFSPSWECEMWTTCSFYLCIVNVIIQMNSLISPHIFWNKKSFPLSSEAHLLWSLNINLSWLQSCTKQSLCVLGQSRQSEVKGAVASWCWRR